MFAWFKTKKIAENKNVTQTSVSSGADPRCCAATSCYKVRSVPHRLLCLILCVSLLFSAPAPKAEAVVLVDDLAIGVAAILILMSVGVIFNPRTQEDIKAIGQNFQTYMYQWGTSAEKLEEVETWFGGLQLLDPDDDDDWSPNKTKIKLARGILAGISAWCASVMLGLRKVEDTSQTDSLGFQYLRIQSSYPYGYQYFFTYSGYVVRLLQSSYYNNQLVVFSGDATELFGWFWEDGILKTGVWRNPDGIIHASDFGIYPDGSLELVVTAGTEIPICFSKEIAESRSDYLTSDYLFVDWEKVLEDPSPIYSKYLQCFRKYSYNSTWEEESTSFTCFSNYIFNRAVYTYYPASVADVVWDQVAVLEPGLIVGDIASDLESGKISEEELPLVDLDYGLILPAGQSVTQSIQNVVQQFYGESMTLDKYLELTQAADYGAAAPSIVVNIPAGSGITYYQGAVPSPLTVLGSSPDGGTISYEWYRYGTDPDGKVYPVEVLDEDNSLLPLTQQLGTSYYYCRIYNTDPNGMVNYVHTPSIKITVVADPNVGTDPEPGPGNDPGSDSDVDQNIGTGEDYVGQLQDMIPKYSEGFAAALSEFAANFSYEGTEAVLTIPAIITPEIPGPAKGAPLLNSYLLLEEQKIDFEEASEIIPDVVLLLAQCLLTGALIVFCCKELYDTIAYLLTLRKEA